MKYRGIIFDLDGVICHTDQYHYQAWQQIADELGIYFDETINHQLRGVSRMESFEIMLEHAQREMGRKQKYYYTDKKNEIYKELLTSMSPADLTEETLQTLEKLKSKGIKLAIGSSSKNARFILEQIGLGTFFNAISDGNNIAKSKPDPEVFLKAAEFISENPKDCLVVEDAFAGVQAAVAGGMDCAGIGEAAKHPEATYCLYTFSELLQIIK